MVEKDINGFTLNKNIREKKIRYGNKIVLYDYVDVIDLFSN